ncbi:MAG: hypothetical protein QF441_07860 [Bacteriovoracaceae bacterium]|jgi:hypothetical protein|nr:hypothetical protein [Bacteriovoracaceae bacterium]
MIRTIVNFWFLLIGFYSLNAIGFPIFYTCENEVLKNADKIDPKNLFEKILKMSNQEQRTLLNNWCNGKDECLENLKTILQFSNSSYPIAEELFLKELEKLNNGFNLKINDKKLLQEILDFKNEYLNLQACQNTIRQLSPEDYIHNQSVLIPYPYHSNYMYVTGCRSVNTRSCNPINKESLDRVIAEAISMGTDPYVAIALTLMEVGTDMGSLYLDPIGVMDAVGCGGKQLRNDTLEEVLNSYGTSFKINASVKRNKRLSNDLESFLRLNVNQEVKQGKSYYCYDIVGNSNPDIFTEAQSNSCCLELDFHVSKDSTSNISHALTYEFINKRTEANFRGKEGPEWKLQRFNGYTNLMGAAESVPSWRVGVNYYDNPGYGQQAMDYILNSLLFNPYISKKIDEESKKSKTSWRSILCKGREDGTFYYDSNFFFNSVKDSERLGVIYEKFKKDIPYDKLSMRELQVMNRELSETSKQNSQMPDLLKESIWNKYDEEVYNAIQVDVEDLFIKSNVDKEVLWINNKEKLAITRNEFDEIMTYLEESDSLTEKYDEVDNRISDFASKIWESCDSLQDDYEKILNDTQAEQELIDTYYKKYDDCYNESSAFSSMVNSDTIEESKNYLLSKDSKLFNLQEDALKLLEERIEIEKAQEELYRGDRYKKIMRIFKKDNINITNLVSQRFKYESLSSALERLKKMEGYNLNVEKMIIALHGHETATLRGYDYQAAYEEYFNKIYSSRKTLEKTSDYSWERLSEEQIRKIVRKIKR